MKRVNIYFGADTPCFTHCTVEMPDDADEYEIGQTLLDSATFREQYMWPDMEENLYEKEISVEHDDWSNAKPDITYEKYLELVEDKQPELGGVGLIAPISDLKQEGDTKALIKALMGDDGIPCEGSINGDSASIAYYDTDSCLGYTVGYSWEPAEGLNVGRVTNVSLWRNEMYDHAFDLTRERLAEVLAEHGDSKVAKEIAAKFAIRL
jgi:hypothetical protein